MAETLIGGPPPTTARSRGRTRSSRLRRCGAAGSVLLIVLGLAGGRWWATSADAFGGTSGINGSSFGVDPGTATHWYGFGPLPSVRVTGVEVELAADSGPASTAVSLCLPGSPLGGGLKGDLSPSCRGLAPIVGTDLATWPEGSFAALTVVPLTTATVHVVGVRVSFEEGWRTGEQTVPVDLAVVTEPMPPLPGQTS